MPALPPFLLSNRILLICVSVIIILTCFSIGATFLLTPKEQAGNNKPEPAVHDKTISRVFIKDFYKYGEYFTPQKQLAVEKVLYAYTSPLESTPDLYTGTIRNNSFIQTKGINNVIKTRFLVDVGPVGVTYILEVNGTIKDGDKPVLIQCAPENQQQNTSLTCIDGMKSRE